MGFYFRKSVRFGLLRVNFSKSGVGLSAGIRGLRVGTGPRGNYIRAGAHGFYYQATLPPVRQRGASRPVAPTRPANDPPTGPETLDPTVGTFEAIESGDASRMVDSSSEALLEEIRNKHSRVDVWRGIAALSGFGVVAEFFNNFPSWALGVTAVLGIGVTALAFRWDVQRKLTIVHYDLNPRAIEAFGQLVDAVTRLQQCNRLWHLRGQSAVLDRKYHAGAATSVSRAAAAVGTRLPPYLAANVDPVTIALTKLTLYFFPDRILVYQGSHVGAITYGALECHVAETRFVEDEAPPGDADVVGRTWRYVNAKGGPDRRFKNNRELPICRYGELILRSGSGLYEILQLSKPGAAADLGPALKGLADIASQS